MCAYRKKYIYLKRSDYHRRRWYKEVSQGGGQVGVIGSVTERRRESVACRLLERPAGITKKRGAEEEEERSPQLRRSGGEPLKGSITIYPRMRHREEEGGGSMPTAGTARRYHKEDGAEEEDRSPQLRRSSGGESPFWISDYVSKYNEGSITIRCHREAPQRGGEVCA